jgi:hypothetical protein
MARGADSYSSHSVTKRGLTCIATCLSVDSPEFLNPCSSPAGTTTMLPAGTSTRSSPPRNVGLPLQHDEHLGVFVPVQ